MDLRDASASKNRKRSSKSKDETIKGTIKDPDKEWVAEDARSKRKSVGNPYQTSSPVPLKGGYFLDLRKLVLGSSSIGAWLFFAKMSKS